MKLEHTDFHDKEHYGSDCPRCLASLTPLWIREYEKEQDDRLEILRKEVGIKRALAFGDSLFGDREHQIKMTAMTSAYDVVLNLIKEMNDERTKT